MLAPAAAPKRADMFVWILNSPIASMEGAIAAVLKNAPLL